MRWLLFALPLLLLACRPTTPVPPPQPDVASEGVVMFIDLEGGFYGIVAEDGTRYRPVNLPEPFERDGLDVWFEARLVDDVVGIQMWGTAVEVVNIEER